MAKIKAKPSKATLSRGTRKSAISKSQVNKTSKALFQVTRNLIDKEPDKKERAFETVVDKEIAYAVSRILMKVENIAECEVAMEEKFNSRTYAKECFFEFLNEYLDGERSIYNDIAGKIDEDGNPNPRYPSFSISKYATEASLNKLDRSII